MLFYDNEIANKYFKIILLHLARLCVLLECFVIFHDVLHLIYSIIEQYPDLLSSEVIVQVYEVLFI